MGSETDSSESSARQPMVDITNKVVRYVGTSNERTITERQWSLVLDRPHKAVTWLRDAPFNDVPLSEFDLDAREFSRCILADHFFRVVTLGE
jgi:hypothetical protein